MDHGSPRAPAVTQRERGLGQAWRSARTEDRAPRRRKREIDQHGRNEKKAEGEQCDGWRDSGRAVGAVDRAEATVLGQRAGGRTVVVGMGRGGDTEEQNAHQAAQGQRVTPHGSLSQMVHTSPPTLKEPVMLVNTLWLQMNMSRNKKRGPCSR
jgi:hypothetical protein